MPTGQLRVQYLAQGYFIMQTMPQTEDPNADSKAEQVNIKLTLICRRCKNLIEIKRI